MDESHLSLGGGHTTHVHPVFSALPLALGAWVNSFSSETLLHLQCVPGPCTLSSYLSQKCKEAKGFMWGDAYVLRSDEIGRT